MKLNKLSHKSINSWLLLAALFAPIVYLFGALFTTQLGAHGEMNLANDSDTSVKDVVYEGKSFAHYFDSSLDVFIKWNNPVYDSQQYYSMCFGHDSFVFTSGDPWDFVGNNIEYDSFDDNYIYFYLDDYDSSEPYSIWMIDEITGESNWCMSFFNYVNVDTCWCYWEVFFDSDGILSDSYSWYSDGGTWHFGGPSYLDLLNGVYFYKPVGIMDPVLLASFDSVVNRDIPESTLSTSPSDTPQNAQGFSDYLFGQFFARDNFLAKSGKNVIEGTQNYGFQPMGELIRFTDANMLHLANLEYGYLMIGYAYYAMHVIFLDLIVYLTLFIPRLIRGLVERMEGGVDL